MNDGEWHTNSPLEVGLNEAFVQFYEKFGGDWTHVTIKKLNCDKHENRCYKYAYTILNSEDYRNETKS